MKSTAARKEKNRPKKKVRSSNENQKETKLMLQRVIAKERNTILASLLNHNTAQEAH